MNAVAELHVWLVGCVGWGPGGGRAGPLVNWRRARFGLGIMGPGVVSGRNANEIGERKNEVTWHNRGQYEIGKNKQKCRL